MSNPGYDYDAIPVGFYDAVFHRWSGVQSKWHHLKYRRVRRELPGSGCHLDVGCGPGTFIGTLPASITSVGVDIAAPQLEFARARYASAHRRFELMQPGRLSFDDATFDVVTAVELIEHLAPIEAHRLVGECARVLKSGGKLVLTTPNYAAVWPVIETVLNRVATISYRAQHITRYRPASLLRLQKAGLGAPRVEGFLFLAPFAAVIGWSLADLVEHVEPRWITRRLGHLLITIAIKP